MPVAVVEVRECELAAWLEHYARRGYRCRLAGRGVAECVKRVNEVMDHIVIIRAGGSG